MLLSLIKQKKYKGQYNEESNFTKNLQSNEYSEKTALKKSSKPTEMIIAIATSDYHPQHHSCSVGNRFPHLSDADDRVSRQF